MEARVHRARAREALRGRWGEAILVSFAAGAITDRGHYVKLRIGFSETQPLQLCPSDLLEQVLRILGLDAPGRFTAAVLLLMLTLLLGGPVKLGKARYDLNRIDRRDAGFRDLTTGFPRFLPALWMHLLQSLLVFSGWLLCIVPGVILFCDFSMAPYILSEDPDCGGWEALMRSRTMMRGQRLALCRLLLTFLGWALLSSFSFGIGPLLLTPYVEAAMASFYRHLQNADADFVTLHKTTTKN